MSKEDDDRRGGPRLHLTVPVTMHMQKGTCDAHTMNMSCRGFLLLTDELLPLETQLSVEMTLPGTEEVLLADCEVVWVSEQITIESEVHKGMGVRLLGFHYDKKDTDSSS
jgi:hypothetical protein